MNAEVHVVGGAIRAGSRVLAAQRGPAMSLAGQWEFPGGKVEPDEPPRLALARELHEELGVEVVVGELIGRSRLQTARMVVVLDVYWCEIARGEIELREHSAARWLGLQELGDVDWAAADVPIVEMIADELAGVR